MKEFEKIIGYEQEKQELMRLCDLMLNKEKYLALGVEMPKAILLHGDPGLGKTLMANALIKASGRKCYSCKKNRSDGEFVDKIRETFKSAINNQPSIVFLDDMDKFAQDNLREDSNKEEFVAIQSCFEDLRDKDVFVVATANEILNIPYSLLREGRFGNQLQIKSPSKTEAVKIIEYYLKNKKVEKNITAEFVADLLDGRSCAFLESVINDAGAYAGFENSENIKREHLIKAIMRLTSKSLPSCEQDEFRRKLISYHEAGHAVAAICLGQKVAFVTSKGYGKVGGFCSISTPENKCTIEDFKREIITTLAGKASVEIIFNTVDLGTESDIKLAMQITRYHLEKLAIKGFGFVYDGNPYADKQPTKRVEEISDKISEVLQELYNETIKLLSDNVLLLKAVGNALFEKGILFDEDICKIIKQIKP